MALLSPPNHNLVRSDFGKRILSSGIAGPLAVAAVIFGSPYVDILSVVLLAILLWEWAKMSGLPLSHPINGISCVLLGWVILGTGTFLPMLSIVGVGLLFSAFYHYQVGATKFYPSAVLLAGPLYSGLGIAAMLSLAKFSPLLIVWALVIVWATDIAAYVVGSLLGGAKLAPRISPGKTWSGCIGGSIIGTLAGITAVPYCHIILDSQFFLLGLTFLMTILAHAGDLLESAAKRLFHVKDSGHFLPGHGGLFDRLDSLLLVSLFLAIVKFFGIVS